MDDREYWTKQLREAEQELAAAKRRRELNAAAKKLQRAKGQLKRLEAESAERPKRVTRGSRSAGASFITCSASLISLAAGRAVKAPRIG